MAHTTSWKISALLLFTTIFLIHCQAQTSSTIPANGPQSSSVQCNGTGQLDPHKLEDSPTVLTAATGVATQMIGDFDSRNPEKPPDVSAMVGNIAISIIVASDVCPNVSAKAQDAGTAQATTAQTKATAQATTAQTNKQVSSPPGTDGSTSTVQKVAIPQLLAVAVENGAVTNNVTGTTMTLSTSPYGFVTAFQPNSDTQSNYQEFRTVSLIGVSATFNVADSTDALASATRKQVSQWQIKGTFRDTSVRSSTVNALFNTYLKGPADKIVSNASNKALADVYSPLIRPAEAAYSARWSSDLQTSVAQQRQAADTGGTPDTATVAKKLLQVLDADSTFQTALKQALAKTNTVDVAPVLKQFEQGSAEYQQQEAVFEKEVADLAKGWNGDALFGQRFPTSTTNPSKGSTTGASATAHMPDYLLGELDISCDPKDEVSKAPQRIKCPLGPHTSFTGNFSGTFYTEPNASLNESTFRGAQAALQARWNIGSGFAKIKAQNDKSAMTLSINASYERLEENKHQTGKRPDIVLGSVRLEVPISGGTSIPLSFSVANATEQIKETHVFGNFGLSFDLDKLMSLLQANR